MHFGISLLVAICLISYVQGGGDSGPGANPMWAPLPMMGASPPMCKGESLGPHRLGSCSGVCPENSELKKFYYEEIEAWLCCCGPCE
ncbi:CLUMA_CG016178, isoform A [Clunio marinus]|uniref:CLUMA_CG016178, isoform A n=1 Tax=Clunio marinus TaxID=568069 RepID=A0A1J1ITR6_9DIPT|nr:CLUMA_CG016178, isoform A [Clunio marinus]